MRAQQWARFANQCIPLSTATNVSTMASAVNPAIIPGIPVAAIATNQNFKLKSGLGSGSSFWLTVVPP
jgi:hypothetical protein